MYAVQYLYLFFKLFNLMIEKYFNECLKCTMILNLNIRFSDKIVSYSLEMLYIILL